MSAGSRRSPDGTPSTTTPTAGPWDSPHVVTVKRRPIELDMRKGRTSGGRARREAASLGPDGILRPVTALAKNQGVPSLAWSCAFALACALVLGSGCAPRAAGDDAYFGDTSPPPGQVFTFNNGAEPEHLDPARDVRPARRAHRPHAVRGAVTSDDPRTLEPIPGQAYRWDLSADGLTYTFHLRRASPGPTATPLTAQRLRVVVAARARRPRPQRATPASSTRSAGAEAFNKGELADSARSGLAAPDDSTLVVHAGPADAVLPGPHHVLHLPAGAAARGRALGRRAGRAPGTLVGNGAFALASWRPERTASCSCRNPRYWDAARCGSTASSPTRRRPQHLDQPVQGRRDRLEPQRLHPVAVHPLPAALRATSARPLPGALLLLVQRHAQAVRRRAGCGARSTPRSTARRSRKRPAQGQPRRAWGNITPDGYPGYCRPPALALRPGVRARVPGEGGLSRAGGASPRIEILFNTSEDHRRIAEAVQAMWKRDLGIAVELRTRSGAQLPAGHHHAAVRRRAPLVDRRLPRPEHVPRPAGAAATATTAPAGATPRYDALLRRRRRRARPGRAPAPAGARRGDRCSTSAR